MIDKQAFAEYMGQLGGAYGREIDAPVSRMYYAILSARLTTEQFIAAIAKTLAAETFWPAPAKILEHAGVGNEDEAELAFKAMSATVRDHGGYLRLPHEVFAQFDPAVRAAIKAVGGLREIAERSGPDKRPALLKRFVRAYNESRSGVTALPIGQSQERTLALVRSVAKDMALPPGDR